jgi:hypothetical protein
VPHPDSLFGLETCQEKSKGARQADGGKMTTSLATTTSGSSTKMNTLAALCE